MQKYTQITFLKSTGATQPERTDAAVGCRCVADAGVIDVQFTQATSVHFTWHV